MHHVPGKSRADLSKAMDEVTAGLQKALRPVEAEDPLAKASHDAMAHHAVHSAAATKAGKNEEAKQHKFMMLRHGLEAARGKRTAGDMEHSMRRNMEHYSSEASGEVGYSYMDGTGDKEHPATKHFKGGGGFKAHPHDAQFKEDYAGKKAGPKVK